MHGYCTTIYRRMVFFAHDFGIFIYFIALRASAGHVFFNRLGVSDKIIAEATGLTPGEIAELRFFPAAVHKHFKQADVKDASQMHRSSCIRFVF
jgi:hypothetical protein